MAWTSDRTWEPASTCYFGPELLAAIGLGAAEGAGAGGVLGTGISAGTIGAIGTVASTAATIGGTLLQRNAAQQGAESNAAALEAKAAADRVQANQDAAVAQRQAIDERRKTELVQSRLRAVAAAGGGDATDPSTLALGSQIAGQGEYNALSRVAAGQTSEAAQNYQAELDLSQAQRYRQAGDIASSAALFSGLGTLSSNLSRSAYLFPRGRTNYGY